MTSGTRESPVPPAQTPALRPRIVLIAALANILIGAGALWGWLALRPEWVQWNRHLAPMPFNAAVSLVLVGLGLVLLYRGLFQSAVLVSLPVVLYSTLAAVSQLAHTHLGINHPLWLPVQTPHFFHRPVRISPLSCAMLMVASCATVFAGLVRARAPGPAAGALLVALSAAGLIGQLTFMWPIWRALREVSLPGSLAFFTLGAAVLARGWTELRARRLGLAFVTATMLLTVTVVLTAAVNTYEDDELMRMTGSVLQGVADQIRAQEHRPLAVARLAARWKAFGMPTVARAEEGARLLQQQVPGLHAVIWVAPSSRVVWRVPNAGYPRVVGRFLDADPRRALVLERARMSDHPAMTSLIPLFKGGRGFVVVAPVRIHGRFIGYLGGIFDTRGLLSRLVANLWQGYHVSVWLHGQRFFVRGRPGAVRYRHTGHVRFLGQSLTIAVTPGARIVRKIAVGLPAIVLTSGLLLTLFAAAAVYAMQEAQRHAASLDRLNAGLENLVLARTAALREERERWRVTLMSIGDGVIVTDREGRVRALNAEAERLTGYRDDEARGLPVDSVFPLHRDLEGPPVEGPVAQALRSGQVQHLRSPAALKTYDGRVLQVSDSAAPIRDEDGEVTGAIMVFRDVTQRQALEEQAMRVKSLEALGVLAGGIAHDFNNILTAIFGNITLAKIHAPGDEALQGALADAERASWRARELTFQLLTFAKGGAPVKKPGSIGETVRELTGFFVKGSAVGCEIDIPEDLWPTEFDPDQMGQVIQNIVLNAKEAMSGAGVLRVTARNVTLAATEIVDLAAGDYVEIAFRDSGRGIAPEYLARIFDPYFSLKPSGTGLGLAVTYSVVKRHQGMVTAHSVVGHGTTLTLYLPRSGVEPRPAVDAPGHGPVAALGHGRRILIMDDDRDVRAIGVQLLQSLGYEVAEAADGNEAVRLYEKARARRPFDAVILDLTVPGGMGGKECVRKLRERDDKVRAIVATGYYTDPIMAQYQAYGFDASVQKPYRLEDLAAALARALG